MVGITHDMPPSVSSILYISYGKNLNIKMMFYNFPGKELLLVLHHHQNAPSRLIYEVAQKDFNRIFRS